jgi:hypothetical protein
MKREVSYDYNYAGFPSSGGFTIVPMEDATTPSLAQTDDFQISSIATPESAQITITTGEQTVNTHRLLVPCATIHPYGSWPELGA